MAHWQDGDVDGPAPWALGDADPEPLDRWGTDVDGAGDDWLDDQLSGRRSATGADGDSAVGDPDVSSSDAGMVVRRPAPRRAPRPRRADGDAVADLPTPEVRATSRLADGSSITVLQVPVAQRDGDEIVFRVKGTRAVLARTTDLLELAGSVPVPAATRGGSWDEVRRHTRPARATARR